MLALNIIPAIATKSACFAAAKSIVVAGLMLHTTGTGRLDAPSIVNQCNNPNAKVAVHAVIDGNQDYTVYQSLPWETRGWHCGSGKNGSGNDGYIGIEMTEPDCITYNSGSSTFTCSDLSAAKESATRTYNTAVWLFAKLCIEYNLDPLEPGVIISHHEGYELGIATNHDDPERYWNQLGINYTMDKFRKAVKAEVDLMRTTDTSTYGSEVIFQPPVQIIE